ncbi:MAG: TetR/AcrR family transcriptional regulator [Bacillota bacterium]|nr:TetR/AcrR family transcriptional regulator [Bacillota bacterium]
MNRISVNKGVIIETTLGLIEKNQGIKGVNLRGISKEIGCAHTNIYNYYHDLNEIFWESLGQVMMKMMEYVDENSHSQINSEENFYLFLSSIISFSMEHPGWYRLIWLEHIEGIPSSKIIAMINKPKEGFIKEVMKSNNTLSEKKANLISDILITYLHGELSKWINNRNANKSIDETKKSIISNLKFLYKLLINEEMN